MISYEAFRILFSRDLPHWLLILAFLVILIHGLDRGNVDGTE